MKFFLILFAFVVNSPLLFGQKVKAGFHIKGTVSGRDTGMLVLRYIDGSEKMVRDTVMLNHGNFEFKGSINQPTYSSLMGYRKIIDFKEANNVGFFLEPSDLNILLVENDYDHVKILGSNTQKELDHLYKSLDSVSYKYQAIDSEYLIMKTKYINNKNDYNLKKADSLYEKLKPRFRESDSVVISFITRFPDSYVSSYMLYHLIRPLSLDSAELLYSSLGDGNKMGRYGKWDMEELARKQQSTKGIQAPDFTREDFNGKKLSLSTFKGQSYILLDFWASWCAPCRAFSPYLKEIYNKYHAKGLDIIGISCETDKTAWKKAIMEDGISMWHHVLENKSPIPSRVTESIESLRAEYNVMPIPVQILIDRNGTIIGRFIAGGNDTKLDLDKKLAEIIGQHAVL